MEPEREMIRRIAPFAVPAAVVAYALGAALDGSGAAWSAAIAVAVVLANFVAHGWSLGWAAGVSPTVLYAVGLGGFVLRLGVIVAIIALLQRTGWFSVVAFAAALVPCTIALLAVEMRLLGGRMQADMWRFPSERAR
jgi:hypothetical protein